MPLGPKRAVLDEVDGDLRRRETRYFRKNAALVLSLWRGLFLWLFAKVFVFLAAPLDTPIDVLKIVA